MTIWLLCREFDDNLRKRIKKVPTTNKTKSTFYGNPFNHMSICFKTKLVKEAGGYPIVDLKEDYALWIKLLGKKLKVKNINKVLVNVSAGEDMYLRRRGFNSVKSELKIQKLLLENKLTNYSKSVLILMIRSFILFMPPKFIKFIYSYFLR